MSTKKSIVVTGPTVEAAIKKGLVQLGVGPSQVIVEVLDEPVRGLFGIGARQARVRLQALVVAPLEVPPAEPAMPEETAPVVADMVEPVAEAVDPTEPQVPVEDVPSETAPAVAEAADAEDVEDEPPAQTSDVAEKAAFRVVTPGTYEDDDFFDEDGNFYEDVEVLDRGPSVVAPKEDRTYVRRLSFVKPKSDVEEATPNDEVPKVTEAKLSLETELKQVEAAREEVVTDDEVEPEPDVLEQEGNDDEAQEVPTLNRGRRGPARFENFERRGRRYDDDDDSEADDDIDAVATQDESDDVVSDIHDDEETDTFVDVLDVPDTADDRTLAELKLSAMMDIMGLDMAVEVSQAKRDDDDDVQSWILNLRGDDASGEALVGEDGETLSALQFLTRLMVSKQTGDRANIVVDVNEHRLRRTDRLADLANRMADEAIERGRKVKMEPMSSHERRIVHMVLRRRGDVKTDSVGKGDKRRVMIAPKIDETD